MTEANNEDNVPAVNVKERVMEQIKAKDIRMTHPLFFLAQKIGLQSVLALAVLGGALAVAVILYIFKKIGIFTYLRLGIPGLKVFILSVPYDYIALLLITILVGNYIVRKLDFSHSVRNSFDIPAAALLVVTVFIGAFFAVMGGEQLFKGLYGNRKAPREIAISGKIVDVSDKEIVVQDKDGKLKKIIFEGRALFPYTSEYALGKFLSAVGKLDAKNPFFFHAEGISCCEEE